MIRIIRGCMVLVVAGFVLPGMLAGCSDEPQSVAVPNVNESQNVEDALNESQDAEDIAKFKEVKQAAEQGDAQAQLALGKMYVNGQSVAQNDVEAVKWVRKAAEQGYAMAQLILGGMYANGQGVAKDEAEVVKWVRKAAEQGLAPAQYLLGLAYADGVGGVVTKNEAEAVKWYQKAAEQGDADAQYNLGMMYEFGQGVAKNEAEAVKWYQKAAEQGNKIAQAALDALKEPVTAVAGQSDSLKLFGTKLKNATRTRLHAAFKQSPLKAVLRMKNIDSYDSSAALEGSSSLGVGYVPSTEKFAYAEYTFKTGSGFGDEKTQQIQRIIDMVAAKYGEPDKFDGDARLSDEVDAIWKRDGDLTIKVYSDWAGIRLRYSDPTTEGQMNAEIEAEEDARKREKAASQSDAF